MIHRTSPTVARRPVALIEPLEERRLLAAPYGVRLESPEQRSVFQRGTNNAGLVQISGTFTGDPSRIEARALLVSGSNNVGYKTGWTKIAGLPSGGEFSGKLVVRAGGWYRIQVRGVGAEGAGKAKQAKRIGVGDVYFLAGQSNMEGTSGSSQATNDRVTVADYPFGSHANPNRFVRMSDTTRVGPAPNGRPGPAGALGDLLAADQKVPVLFLNASAPGTTIGEWRDVAEGGSASSDREYSALRQALKYFVPKLGGARAVLWHQGEQDANPLVRTSTDKYAEDLAYVIRQSRIDSGLPNLPWLVARVTSLKDTEPTVTDYDLAIEKGQEKVIASDPLVYAGPLTDDIERRTPNNVHYTDAGQAEHGRRWFARLKETLFSREPIVTVTATDATASEGGSTGRFTLYRTGFTNDPLTVSFSLGGKATNGKDYAALKGTATFAKGSPTAEVRIAPIADGATEPKESVTLTLLDGANHAMKTYDPAQASPLGSAGARVPATHRATLVIS